MYSEKLFVNFYKGDTKLSTAYISIIPRRRDLVIIKGKTYKVLGLAHVLEPEKYSKHDLLIEINIFCEEFEG